MAKKLSKAEIARIRREEEESGEIESLGHESLQSDDDDELDPLSEEILAQMMG